MSRLRPRSWWWFAFVAITLVIFGATDVAAGATADPGIPMGLTGKAPEALAAEGGAAYRMFDFTTRTQGWGLVIVGLLLLAVVAVPYRAGEPWAWWTMWLVPAWSLGVAAFFLAAGLDSNTPPPPPMVSGPMLSLIGVLVLLVDRRRFATAA